MGLRSVLSLLQARLPIAIMKMTKATDYMTEVFDLMSRKISVRGMVEVQEIRQKYPFEAPTDHLRHGDFTTTFSLTESGRTSSATCKTDYAMGYANGLWSITESGEAKSVSFTNNVGNGNFSYKTQDLSITGKMNDKGLLDGDIVFIEGKWKTTITYDNGFQLSYVSKNTQTGEITEREETSEEQIAYFSKYGKPCKNKTRLP